jgi:hypothetical protein
MLEEIASYMFIGLAFTGLVIAWLGWRARGNAAGRWCPACQEDLSKDLSRTCSSCGFSSPNEAAFHLARPRWGIVIIGLSVVSLASVLLIRNDFSDSVQGFIGPVWALEERVKLPGGWVAEIHRSNDLKLTNLDRRVRLIDDGKTRFEWMGWFARFGTENPTTGETVGVGEDIDRDGAPDLLIRTNDDGDSEASRVLLLSLATRSGVYRIETRAILPEGWFMTADDDSQRRFHAIDQLIDDGWGLSGSVSKPTLVLALGRKSSWSVDFEATRAQTMPPSMRDFDSSTIVEASFDAWKTGDDPQLGRLLSFATHLLYRGRIHEARAVLGAEWPGDDDPERLKLFMSGSRDSGFPNYRPDPAWRLEAFKSAIEASPRRIELQEMARIGSPPPKR